VWHEQQKRLCGLAANTATNCSPCQNVFQATSIVTPLLHWIGSAFRVERNSRTLVAHLTDALAKTDAFMENPIAIAIVSVRG
jgi:hypothetical protein